MDTDFHAPANLVERPTDGGQAVAEQLSERRLVAEHLAEPNRENRVRPIA